MPSPVTNEETDLEYYEEENDESSISDDDYAVDHNLLHAHCSRCQSCMPEGIERKSYTNQNGDVRSVCMDCAAVFLDTCKRCNRTFPKTYMKPVPAEISDYDYDQICQYCFSDAFTLCNLCGQHVRANDSPTGNSCQDCLEKFQYRCLRCKSVRHRTANEPLIDKRKEGEYCPTCYTNVAHCSEPKVLEKVPYKRFVGYEIEFFVPYGTRLDGLSRYGWIKSDGSIRPNTDRSYTAHEFASFAYGGDDLYDSIDSVCAELRAMKAQVNASCGLHLHIDMQREALSRRSNVFNAFKAYQRIIYGITTPSRRESTYARMLPMTARYDDYVRGDRYYGLNVSSMHKHGTFEIRLHHATTNASKIKFWSQFMLRFFYAFLNRDVDVEAISRKSDRENLIELIKLLKLPKKYRQALVYRAYYYGKSYIKIAKSTRPDRIPPFVKLPELKKKKKRNVQMVINGIQIVETPFSESVTRAVLDVYFRSFGRDLMDRGVSASWMSIRRSSSLSSVYDIGGRDLQNNALPPFRITSADIAQNIERGTDREDPEYYAPAAEVHWVSTGQ